VPKINGENPQGLSLSAFGLETVQSYSVRFEYALIIIPSATKSATDAIKLLVKKVLPVYANVTS
jgi:hypothetical protein